MRPLLAGASSEPKADWAARTAWLLSDVPMVIHVLSAYTSELDQHLVSHQWCGRRRYTNRSFKSKGLLAPIHRKDECRGVLKG